MTQLKVYNIARQLHWSESVIVTISKTVKYANMGYNTASQYVQKLE